MRTLTVPERYANGLAKIMGLSAEQVEAVIHQLQNATLGTQKEMASSLKSALPDLSSEDVKAMAETLRSLYSVRTDMDLPVEQFVASLLTAIRQNEDLHLKDPSELSRVEKTLTSLLNIRPLSVMSKARDLQIEFENTFCDARVITDMRPVFDTNIKEGPIGTILTHTLKIEYHDNRGEHIEIHIALDKKEIETMISVLNRALDKGVALSEVTAKAGLKILAE